jgi:hypothetical protein
MSCSLAKRAIALGESSGLESTPKNATLFLS